MIVFVRRILNTLVAASAVAVALGASRADAQPAAGSVDIGPNLSVLRLSELDTTDVGIGVDASWHLMPRITIDGSLALFPGSGDDTSLSDQRRVLGLVGVRSGITRGRVDIYGRGRVGFLNFGEAGPFACSLIYPAPLSCQLAAGYTAFAVDLGGGAIVPVDSEGKWRVRVDVGDLIVRYGLDAIRSNGRVTDGFLSHNLLFSAGLVFKF
jgi:hypothetical protein